MSDASTHDIRRQLIVHATSRAQVAIHLVKDGEPGVVVGVVDALHAQYLVMTMGRGGRKARVTLVKLADVERVEPIEPRPGASRP